MTASVPASIPAAPRPVRRGRLGYWTLLLVALVAAGLTVRAEPARAQEEPQGTSYVTPFPAGDTYQMTVIGDTFAEGILYALVEAMGNDSRLVIQRRHRYMGGLMVGEHEENYRQLEDFLAREAPHIAVVMLGEDDRQPLRVQGQKRIPVGADEWRAEYGRRVDRVMKSLKKRGAAVYWVGLPNLRRPEANEDAQMMNEIIRERAYLNGIKYVDAFAGFADEAGGYSAYGPDLTGKIRLLREGDGINFTGAGNRKLAHFVEREVKRDLTQARSERSIPLAGGTAEQEKISRERREAAARQSAQGQAPGIGGTAAKPGSGAAAAAPGPGLPGAARDPGAQAVADQKAENTKISLRTAGAGGRDEIVQIEIVRPAIPASVVQLLTRRESADKASQMGETLIDQIAGGMTVMSSITPAAAGAGAAGRRIAPTLTPYYRLLVKGERLPPKPGRADDHTWPRPEPEAAKPSPSGASPQLRTAPQAPARSGPVSGPVSGSGRL